MTIGPDIEEAIKEVATGYTILRDSGDVTGEFLRSEPNAQITKPFIREFFLESVFTYSSVVVIGDVIEFDTTGDKYLVMNKTPEIFENEIILFNGVLYKCNVSIDIQRPDDTGSRDKQYHLKTAWSLVKASANALLVTPLYGVDLETDEELGLIGVKELELYIPTSVGLQELDRVIVSSTEYYRIETVKKRRYSAVDICDIGEDVRPIIGSSVTTTTSTTTTSTTSTTTTTTTST